MPQLPLMPNTSPMMSQPNQAPAVMGAEDYQNAQLPLMPAEPAFTAPAMVAPYPYPPYPACLYPASPVLPGPGPIPAYGDPFQGYPAMPQVMGAMEEMESPGMMGNMPHQMPMAPNMPPSAVGGVTEDCGCGGSNLLGTYGPGMAGGYMYGRGYSPEMTGGYMTGGGYYPGMAGGHMTGGGYHPGMAGGHMTWGGHHPGMAGGYMHDGGYGSGMAGGYMPGTGYDYGMGGGFAPGAGYGPGMFGYPSGAGYGPGTTGFSPGMHGPSYGQPFTGQPFMNPYGSTGAEQGMGRNLDEFEEENED
jgi:hypothetical protein